MQLTRMVRCFHSCCLDYIIFIKYIFKLQLIIIKNSEKTFISIVNLDPIDEKLLEEEPIGLTDQKR